MVRKVLWPAAVVILGASALAWAAEPAAAGGSEHSAGQAEKASAQAAEPAAARGSEHSTGQAEKASAQATGVNLEALHDPQSASYDGQCLNCHQSVLKEATKDPRTPSFHKAMMPFTPGYNPAHGPNNGVCVQCHRYVELREDSAGALRKQVDPKLCAMCHGPSGPGPKFYQW